MSEHNPEPREDERPDESPEPRTEERREERREESETVVTKSEPGDDDDKPSRE